MMAVATNRKIWRRAVFATALGGVVGVILLKAIPFESCADDDSKPSSADSSDRPAAGSEIPTTAEDPKPNPLPTAEELAALAEGKAMYRGLCSGCHG